MVSKTGKGKEVALVEVTDVIDLITPEPSGTPLSEVEDVEPLEWLEREFPGIMAEGRRTAEKIRTNDKGNIISRVHHLDDDEESPLSPIRLRSPTPPTTATNILFWGEISRGDMDWVGDKPEPVNASKTVTLTTGTVKTQTTSGTQEQLQQTAPREPVFKGISCSSAGTTTMTTKGKIKIALYARNSSVRMQQKPHANPGLANNSRRSLDEALERVVGKAVRRASAKAMKNLTAEEKGEVRA
ncbi:hypothetical protein HK102_001600 [Quaeritorhiza haematococci]|nr:hypothetical protein HK102_001600 [Quaeritorhiza haematococci]